MFERYQFFVTERHIWVQLSMNKAGLTDL